MVGFFKLISLRRVVAAAILLLVLVLTNLHFRQTAPCCSCNNHQEGQQIPSNAHDTESLLNAAAGKKPQAAGEKHKTEEANPNVKFVHDFKAGYDAIFRMQNESLYHIQKETKLPLLRLSAAESNFQHRVDVGKRWMRDNSAVFVGTARNAKDHLPRNVADIHRLGKLFKDYWMVFVENDSKDGTREFLMNVVKQYNKTIILGCEPINSPAECHLNIKYRSGKLHKPGWAQKRNDEELIDRGVTMSVLRNMLLDYIYANLADKVDLMIAIEPDISWDPWNLDNIAQGIYYFSNRPQLDLLCANGRLWGKIYDPCSRTYYAKKHFIKVEEEDLSLVTDKMAVENNKAPIKVDSCYQAFAIYRISSLLRYNAHYYPVPGEWSCEHNTLSRQLSEKYIDPTMMLNIYSLVVHSKDRW